MLFRKSKKQLAEAREENESLAARLKKADETVDHLQHLLKLKTEECDTLSARIKRMEEKVAYAEEVERKVAEIEEQVNKFGALKKSLDHKIAVLRMERDEARALNEARQTMSPAIDFVDKETLKNNTTLRMKKYQREKEAEKTSRLNPDVTDWYEPLGDV